MAKITYHLSDGDRRTVDVAAGDSVMRGATDNDIPGIIAECRGAMTCATCHVHVPIDWYGRFPAPDLTEKDLLEIVDDFQPSSRLSCQLIVVDGMDGLDIFIPRI